MKQQKRLFAFLLALALMAGLMPSLAAGAYAVPEGYTAIATPAELDAVRDNLAGKYILVNDIDLSGWGNWVPIGYLTDYASQEFTGVFDGNGKTIRGMRMEREYSRSLSYPAHGLFWVLNQAVIENLNMMDVFVEARDGAMGAIAGRAAGSTLRNCSVKGKINSVGMDLVCAGGLLGSGSSNTVLEDLRFDGDIFGKDTDQTTNRIYIGGIAGVGGVAVRCESSGTMNIASAAIAGGISGSLNGAADCVNKMNISSGTGPISWVKSDVGGIAGHHGNIYGDAMLRCKNEGNIIGSRNVGGIAGEATAPVLSSENSGSVSAIEGTAPSLGGIAGYAKQTVLRGCTNTGEIGLHTIAYHAGGVAGNMEESQMLYCRNLGKIDAVHGSQPSSYVYCGGLVGFAEGSASVGAVGSSHLYANYNMGDVYAAAGSANGNTGKVAAAGGIAGGLHGLQSTMADCYNRGNVEAVSESAAYAGGLVASVGFENTHIYIGSSYSSGKVTAAAESSKETGGFAGWARGVNFYNCYYYTPDHPLPAMLGSRAQENTRVYRSAHLTAEQMKQAGSFAGFDFTNIWEIAPGQNGGMPRLRALQQPDSSRAGMPADYGRRPITEEEMPPEPLRLISSSGSFTMDYLGFLQLDVIGGVGSFIWKISEPDLQKVRYVGRSGGYFKIISLPNFVKSSKVTITVTDSLNREASCEANIKPTFLQWMKIIFLFGWIWM